MVFYKLISEEEDCFIKNINSPDVYEKTIDDLNGLIFKDFSFLVQSINIKFLHFQ